MNNLLIAISETAKNPPTKEEIAQVFIGLFVLALVGVIIICAIKFSNSLDEDKKKRQRREAREEELEIAEHEAKLREIRGKTAEANLQLNEDGDIEARE